MRPESFMTADLLLQCSWITISFLTTAFLLLFQIALKCADICNPCRLWELSKQWSERVCEEFYRQGQPLPPARDTELLCGGSLPQASNPLTVCYTSALKFLRGTHSSPPH